MRVFFAGALTNLKDYKKTEAFYLRLADAVKDCGHDYFWAFLNGTDPNIERTHTPQYVYDTDTGSLKTSDLMVAYIGEPSTGVGVEIEYANTHNIPVVILYEKDNWTSRMARGCPSVKKEIVFTSEEDACAQLKEYLINLIKTKTSVQ